MGAEQYYCWDCCVEFNLSRGAVRIYYLDVEGELTAAGEEPRGGRQSAARRAAGGQSPVA